MQPDSNNYWTSPILKSTHIDIHNIVNTFALLKASSYEDLSEMHPNSPPNIVNVKCISMSTLENTNSNNYQNVPEHKADDYHDYERNDDNQSVTVH